VALLRMQRDGHILLPAPRRAHYPPSKEVQRTLFALPKPPVEKPAGAFSLCLERVEKETSALWNEYIRQTPVE